MMSSSGDMGDPLTGGMNNGGGDDGASQTSQRSGTSLIERIRAQRNRETQQQQQQHRQPVENEIESIEFHQTQQQQPQSQQTYEIPTQQIQVPQYNPVPTSMEGHGNTGYGNESSNGYQGAGSSNFFSNAWNNIQHSMESGMASMQQEHLEAQDALLPPSAERPLDPNNYSMSVYFMTFVRDIYSAFLKLPLIVRAIVVVFLLWVAIKLL